jgi:acyl carrier protein
LKTQEILKQYLHNELLNTVSYVDLSEDDNLLTSGLVDSLGIMRLIAFIEQSFDLHVRPEEVTLEHFRTINTIAAYIDQRNGVVIESTNS